MLQMTKLQHKKIVVAEDDKGIQEVMKLILEDEGYEVVAVENSDELNECLDKELPQLLLMDIWLPGENGSSITNRLKKNDTTNSLPIIMVSASNDTKERAAEAGADDFLLKPFDVGDLLELVKKHVTT
jgi:DNA-binding response OmpR family regulator